MEQLRALDHIAYIRFASVYQSFEDLEDLKREVDSLFAEGVDAEEGTTRAMSVLADRDIRAELEAGRVRIDPYDPADLQPSSVDLHLDRTFRVFRNNRYAFIDPRQPQPDLTELLAIEADEPFILHPGEFVLGQTLEWVELPDDLVARLEGKSSLGPARAAHPLDRRLRRSGLEGHADARAVERRQPADRAVRRHADRADQLLPDELAGGAAVRQPRARVEVPGPVGADGVRLPRRLRPGPQGDDARGGLGHGTRDAGDWSADLGGGTRVALVQAGTFRTDSGAIFGPVPWILWRPWAEGELDDNRRLLQALNCLMIETPAGRVLVETGIGERLDDKARAHARVRGLAGRAGDAGGGLRSRAASTSSP